MDGVFIVIRRFVKELFEYCYLCFIGFYDFYLDVDGASARVEIMAF